MLSPTLHITHSLKIPSSELTFRFARSGGPGGQNVNKVASKVELLFDVAGSPALNNEQRARLQSRLGSRLDTDGVLHVVVDTSRSQWSNREEAVERFAEILRDALRPVKKRVATRATKGSAERRVKAKKRKSEVKALRGRIRGGGNEF